MPLKFRSSLLASAAVAAIVLPATGSAAPASTSFAIVGYEYAFTSTVGSFAGRGVGNAGETAAWNATVQHDPLGTIPTTYVNGGDFQMATASATGHVDFVSGTFAYHGGMITTLDPGANCTNQQFMVTGTLRNVSTSTSAEGSGDFRATLTHYRVRLFGHCIIYKARVAGRVGFTYQP
jgi:hypothetical protein